MPHDLSDETGGIVIDDLPVEEVVRCGAFMRVVRLGGAATPPVESEIPILELASVLTRHAREWRECDVSTIDQVRCPDPWEITVEDCLDV